jgi:hypothetical protein
MRKFLLVALSCLLACIPRAYAQEASIAGATMLWYGVYTAGSTAVIADPATPTGTRTVSTGITPPNINSDRIPAILNTRFGIGYVLDGTPADGVARIRHVHTFPPGGIVNPATAETNFSEQGEYNFAINRKDLFTGYLFERDFTLVPGVWKFEVWNGDRLLLEKSFTVYKP